MVNMSNHFLEYKDDMHRLLNVYSAATGFLLSLLIKLLDTRQAGYGYDDMTHIESQF